MSRGQPAVVSRKSASPSAMRISGVGPSGCARLQTAAEGSLIPANRGTRKRQHDITTVKTRSNPVTYLRVGDLTVLLSCGAVSEPPKFLPPNPSPVSFTGDEVGPGAGCTRQARKNPSRPCLSPGLTAGRRGLTDQVARIMPGSSCVCSPPGWLSSPNRLPMPSDVSYSMACTSTNSPRCSLFRL